jgi:hypothetical protein
MVQLTREQQVLLLLPLGAFLLWILSKWGSSSNGTHTLEDEGNVWTVKTLNYDSEPIDQVKIGNTTTYFGKKGERAVIRKIEYDKERYTKQDVQKIMNETLVNCKRCSV